MTERVWMIVVLALVGSVAIAQDEQADGGEQKQEEAAQEEALPSLDELLGISEDPGVERDSEALDTNRAELERELTDEELGEQFVEAIRQMEEAADRLQRGRDAGVVTQRLQDEIMLKLDLLIKHSQQQQGGGGSSSNSSDSSGNEPPASNSQGEQQQSSSAQAEGDQAGGGGAAYNEGKNELIDSVGASWGALPQRVRDTLLEGLNDVFSARYKEQTEAYYRRLAEDGAEER